MQDSNTEPKRFGRYRIWQDVDGERRVYMDRFYLWRCKWFSIRFHKLLISDMDRHLHDHPWNWFTIMIKGSYIETTARGEKTVKAGRVNGHKARTAHKLTLLTSEVWTIFVTGGKFREWGFHTEDGWVFHKDYLGEGKETMG